MKKFIATIIAIALTINSIVVPVFADTTQETDGVLVNATVCSASHIDHYLPSSTMVKGPYWGPDHGWYGRCSRCCTEEDPKDYYFYQYACVCGECDYGFFSICGRCDYQRWEEHYTIGYSCSICGAKPAGCHYQNTAYGYTGTSSTFYAYPINLSAGSILKYR